MSPLARAAARGVPVAAAAWATAGAVVVNPAAAAPAALALWTLALLGLWPAAHRSRRRGWIVAVASLAVAAAAATSVAWSLPPREAARSLAGEGSRVLTVDAVVVGKVVAHPDGSARFDAVTVDARTGAERLSGAIPVRISGQVDGADALDVGATVRVRATAFSTEPDDRAALVVRGIDPIAVTAEPSGVLRAAALLRDGLVAASAGLPAPGGQLIPGLAVGDTSAVTADLDAAMKSSSLSHLTAVSGANCALVVGLAFAAGAGLGARRGVRVAAGAVALAGFVVLVTPEPSVVRAATMSSIAMVAVLLGRPGAGLAVLSLAVAALVVADPWLATSIGFALSVAATAALLVLSRPLAAGLAAGMPRALALALSVPLAAQLACGPLIVLLEPSVALYGVAANLLAAPAAPVATVLGMAACLSAPLPVLQAGLTALAWVPAAWIAETAVLAAGLPAASLPWIGGAPGAVLLALVGAAIVVLLVVPRRRAVMRGVAGAAVAVVVGATAGASALTGPTATWTLPVDWAVLACDVGQGDAVLVRSRDEKVALIDTGPDPGSLSNCLRRAGIGRIDLLVLTHYDLDHAGGVAAVVGRVDTVLHGPGGADQLASLLEGGAEGIAAASGADGRLGEARWRVLWPPARAAAYGPGNDSSVVIELTGGGIPSIVLLGDLSASPQRALQASGSLRPPYDIVKVAHHGSADQADGLYDGIAAAVGVISVGADNTYGHPRDELLAALAQAGTEIARTDRDGFVALWSAPGGTAVWRERVGDGG